MTADAGGTRPRVTDHDNPWPGLAPFEEGDSEFFRGREAAIADVVRAILRDDITILFGLSGLGKTSLLRAGVFPELRAADVFPTCVRLRAPRAEGNEPISDASARAALWQQCFEAIRLAADLWQYDIPSEVASGSPWEYFRRRKERFWGPGDTLATPVIVFDQFEEVFRREGPDTISQGALDGFLRDLSEIVSGAVPRGSGKAPPPDGPTDAGGYVYRPGVLKVVFSFREDFLAHVSALDEIFPTIGRNSYRLQAMTVDDAVTAVGAAGAHLIEGSTREGREEVCRRIVATVSGTSQAVDPALLSLFCRELNEQRKEQAQPRITGELVASGDATRIISDFYDTCMTQVSPVTRRFVEEHLVLEQSRSRESAAEEAATSAGVPPADIQTLIAKRIVRREESTRQGRPRLELTHDVLIEPALASKHRDAALAEQRRLMAVRRATMRRWIAAGAVTMSVAAVLVATYIVVLRRANGLVQDQARLSLAKELARQDPTRSVLVLLERRRTADSFALRSTAFEALSQPVAWQEIRHRDSVTWADISRDGTLVVTASADRTARVWRADGSGSVAVLRHPAYVQKAFFSPDMRHVATVSTDEKVRLWSIDGQLASTFDSSGYSPAAAFSPDSRLLAAGAFDGSTRMWQLDGGALTTKLPAVTDDSEIVTVAFDAGSAYVLTAARDGVIAVWTTGPVRSLVGDCVASRDLANAWFVATDPAKQTIAAVSSTGERQLLELVDNGPRPCRPVEPESAHGPGDTASSQPQRQNSSRVIAVRADPLAVLTVTSYAGSELERLHLTTGADRKTVELPGVPLTPATDASWFGDFVAVGFRDGTTRLWRTDRASDPIVLSGQTNRIRHVAADSGHGLMVTASDDGSARLWRIDGSGLLAGLPRVPLTHARNVRSLDVSPDGTRVLTAASNGEAHLWAIDGRRIRKFTHDNTAVVKAAFSPSGRDVLTVANNGIVRVWSLDAADGDPIVRIVPETVADRIADAAFSPDGSRLLIRSQAGIKLHDIKSGNDSTVFAASAGVEPTFAVFDTKGDILFGATDGMARIRTPQGNGDVRTFPRQAECALRDGAFSRDSTIVLTVCEKDWVYVWRVNDASLPALLWGSNSAVFSPDQQTVMTAGADGKVRLWSLVDPGRNPLVLTHGGSGVHGAFSPDGSLIATTGQDGRALLWRADGAEAPLLLEERTKAMLAPVFTPSATHVITGSADGVATIVTIASDLLIDSVRRRTRACLPVEFRVSQLFESREEATRRAAACERGEPPAASPR